MKSHKELADQEFEKQFKDCTLNPGLFTHEAHLRLTWIHINKYGAQQAESTIPNQIIEYVTSLGAKDKYNATVTVAGVKVLSQFIQNSKTNDFDEFIKENNSLLTDFKGLLQKHYKTDIFSSEKAVNEFIEPDLLSFDF